MATKQALAEVMKKLTQAFLVNTGKRLETDTVGLYNNMLFDIPDQALVVAAQECIAHCKFFPTVAEIRDRAYQHESMALELPSPEAAWAELQREMKDKGHYEPPTFSHEIIREAMYAVGGWFHLCVEANHEVVRAQFMKIYQSMLTRRKTDMMMLPETKQFIEDRRKELVGEVKKELKDNDGADQLSHATDMIKNLSGKMRV